MIPVAPWNMMVTTFSPANWWTLIIYLGAVAIVSLHVGTRSYGLLCKL